MDGNARDAAQDEEPDSYDRSRGHDNVRSNADNNVRLPSPLLALHRHCLSCCNGSALQVRLCAAKSCALWVYRYGKKPTADILAEAGDHKIYPLEDIMTVTEFHKNGGSVLKAIKRRCLDCSGGSKSEVRDCQHVTCDLHPFRPGRNPNRAMSPEQREVAAARLRANVERGKAAKVAGGQNSPTHVGKSAEATRRSAQPRLARRVRKIVT
jgi:hypothetical protein